MGDRSVDVAVAENANGSGAIGAVLETSFAETSIASVPLSRLSVSPLNVTLPRNNVQQSRWIIC